MADGSSFSLTENQLLERSEDYHCKQDGSIEFPIHINMFQRFGALEKQQQCHSG